MCAKKAAPSPAAKKPAAGASRKTNAAENNGATPVVSRANAKKTVLAKAAAPTVMKAAERTLSNQDIGIVAGEIWGLLAAGDAQTVAAIKKSIAAPADVVGAAIGWLAREEKLEFAASGKTLKISLKS